VRDLTRVETLKFSVPAAAASALLGLPRLLLWQEAPLPLWRLEGIVFLGSIVLWAFVFAWHRKYAHRPAFVLRPGWTLFAVATVAGLFCAIVRKLVFDRVLSGVIPGYYPANGSEWVAMLCFSLGFAQLMLLFAPFAWLVRLSRSPGLAATLTVLFGAFVFVLKIGPQASGLPMTLLAALLLDRVISGSLSMIFYLRGGVLLTCWMHLLVEIRLLPALHG